MSAPAADDTAPHGLTLERHAAIAAAIAEGDRAPGEVLAREGVGEAAWAEATAAWMTRIADEARERPTGATLANAYSEAFARAQDALAPLRPMDAVAWAALTVEVQREGGPARPLARRGLSLADYLRLARAFARRLSADPEESAAFFAAYEAAASAPPVSA
jgi:hypothetical protein